MKYRYYDAIPLPNGRFAGRLADYPSVRTLETFASVEELRKYETAVNYGVKRSEVRRGSDKK